MAKLIHLLLVIYSLLWMVLCEGVTTPYTVDGVISDQRNQGPRWNYRKNVQFRFSSVGRILDISDTHSPMSIVTVSDLHSVEIRPESKSKISEVSDIELSRIPRIVEYRDVLSKPGDVASLRRSRRNEPDVTQMSSVSEFNGVGGDVTRASGAETLPDGDVSSDVHQREAPDVTSGVTAKTYTPADGGVGTTLDNAARVTSSSHVTNVLVSSSKDTIQTTSDVLPVSDKVDPLPVSEKLPPTAVSDTSDPQLVTDDAVATMDKSDPSHPSSASDTSATLSMLDKSDPPQVSTTSDSLPLQHNSYPLPDSGKSDPPEISKTPDSVPLLDKSDPPTDSSKSVPSSISTTLDPVTLNTDPPHDSRKSDPLSISNTPNPLSLLAKSDPTPDSSKSDPPIVTDTSTPLPVLDKSDPHSTSEIPDPLLVPDMSASPPTPDDNILMNDAAVSSTPASVDLVTEISNVGDIISSSSPHSSTHTTDESVPAGRLSEDTPSPSEDIPSPSENIPSPSSAQDETPTHTTNTAETPTHTANTPETPFAPHNDTHTPHTTIYDQTLIPAASNESSAHTSGSYTIPLQAKDSHMVDSAKSSTTLDIIITPLNYTTYYHQTGFVTEASTTDQALSDSEVTTKDSDISETAQNSTASVPNDGVRNIEEKTTTVESFDDDASTTILVDVGDDATTADFYDDTTPVSDFYNGTTIVSYGDYDTSTVSIPDLHSHTNPQTYPQTDPHTDSHTNSHTKSQTNDLHASAPDPNSTQTSPRSAHFHDFTFLEPGPNWHHAKHVWQYAWEIHTYTLGCLFGLLALYTLLSVLRLCRKQRMLPKSYFLSTNFFVCLVSSTRAFYMLYESYNSYASFSPSLDYFLYTITFPALTSAFGLVVFALLEATGMQLFRPALQKIQIVVGIIVVHLVLSLATDVLAALQPGTQTLRAMLLVCHLFFLVWGLLLFFGYAYIFRKLYAHALKSQKHATNGSPTDHWVSTVKVRSKFTLSTAVKVMFFTAICGLVIVGLEIYAVVDVYRVFTDDRPKSWKWWLYHTVLRVFEFLVCVTISYVSSLPCRYSKAVDTFSCGVLCAPCNEILCCGKTLNNGTSHNRSGSFIDWRRASQDQPDSKEKSRVKNNGIKLGKLKKKHRFTEAETRPIISHPHTYSSRPASLIFIENGTVRFQSNDEINILVPEHEDTHNMNTFQVRDTMGSYTTGVNSEDESHRDLSRKSSFTSGEFFRAPSSLSLAESLGNEMEKVFESFRVDTSMEDEGFEPGPSRDDGHTVTSFSNSGTKSTFLNDRSYVISDDRVVYLSDDDDEEYYLHSRGKTSIDDTEGILPSRGENSPLLSYKGDNPHDSDYEVEFKMTAGLERKPSVGQGHQAAILNSLFRSRETGSCENIDV